MTVSVILGQALDHLKEGRVGHENVLQQNGRYNNLSAAERGLQAPSPRILHCALELQAAVAWQLMAAKIVSEQSDEEFQAA